MNGGRWEGLLRFFVDAKPIVALLIGLLVFGGLYVLPFDLGLSMQRDPVPVDAIPDVGENQQIVFTEWPGRSPRDVEDQVTYPLTTALLGLPGVRTIRSSSMLGLSSIYVIFEDDVEFYWSRARILEKLSSLPGGALPDDATPRLGPDATALGQVFWYTLEGRTPDGETTAGWDLHELRSIQDWTVRYALQSVPGVAEVASVGGYVREYQVDVDPDALRAHDVTLAQVAKAVRSSNLDVGARTLEINRVEYLVRGLGFIEAPEDLAETVVAVRAHTPIRVRDVGRVTLGPAQRRGALDDGGAEAVGGVVVVRFGENPMAVIQRVHQKLEELAPSLPRRTLEDGTTSQVTIVPFYDRTQLIEETLGTLSTALLQQVLITILVVLVMLRSFRSSALISMTLPLGVLGTFVAMKIAGVEANIMALAGIAIAIGTMVDVGIVFVENIAEHLRDAERASEDEGTPLTRADRASVVTHAAAEVAPAVLTSVATTVVSFLPVFALTASEGKLFAPLAYTKSFALVATVLVAIVLLPAVAHLAFRSPRRVAPGTRPSWRLVFERQHLLDTALVLGGIAAAALVWLPAGLCLAALGLVGFTRPWIPARWTGPLTLATNVVAVVAVALLLAHDWMPLGPERGLVASALFLAVVLLLVLGSFALFQRVYAPLLRTFLAHKATFLLAPAALLLFGLTAWLGFPRLFAWLPDSVRASAPATALAHAFPGFGREYMPPFDEGSFLYMPSTMPHASLGQSLAMLSDVDALIAQVPEVERVVGKLGRAESALDPAPISMFEVVVSYRPEYGVDEHGDRVRQWRDEIRSPQDIWDAITRYAATPGLTSAPVLQPISTRIVMLQSGMRAPMGIKVQGPDLASIEAFGRRLETLLKEVPALRRETVFADRVVGKPYLEIDLDRREIGRYGLTIQEVQDVLRVGVGGMTLTRTVEGRERYPVRVRFLREERDSVDALRQLPVATPGGEQVPLGQLASIRYVKGPQVIKAENTFLTSYVLFDKVPGIAEVDAVEQARAFLATKEASGELERPAGVTYRFAGSYENQLRSEARLSLLVPIALALVLGLLYLQFRRTSTTLIIYSGVAVAVAGAMILLWLYGRPGFLDLTIFGVDLQALFRIEPVNLSVAVWVGFIALVGIATDDGVVMATYLTQRFAHTEPASIEEARDRTVEAGLRRIRPCLMTTATTILALLPVVTASGRGADVMAPMALPVLGGMTIELVTLFVVPVLFCAVQESRLRWRHATRPKDAEPVSITS